jgi:hypothetical protein
MYIHAQEEARRVEAENKDALRRQEREHAELKRRHVEELDAINGRVRHTVQAKDKTITALQQQVQLMCVWNICV